VDENLLNAYQSGDPYLYLAKLAGAVPWDGTREEYGVQRDLFKSTTLGLSYGMSKYGLSNKLTNDMGRKVDEEEAQELINKFNRSYAVYHRWTKKIQHQYRKDGYIKLPCGWYMWGDNRNERSVGNVPIQGFASSIMRKAVSLAQDKGLQVILTLHDAIYIELDSSDLESVSKLADCMDEAFRYYFSDSIKPIADVGLDGGLWSPDFHFYEAEVKVGKAELKKQQIYIDGRSKREYEQFKRYFVPDSYDGADI